MRGWYNCPRFDFFTERCFDISTKELQINEEIRDKEIRVITADGEQLGIMSASQALTMAESRNLDLVKIAPQATPPVCKIMDYGKYRFEQSKREKEARKNQRVIQVKEVKFRPNIEDHDFMTKVNNAQRFLADGDKVIATVMFRGREITHPDLGRVLLQKMADLLAETATMEKAPKVEGKNMTAIFAPKANK